ncbi:MAG TPA: hypothetical protein HPP94_12975 [Desulfuromonadales bacterium]|nr:hypothetical protein [Desulfuromonadales bacterium]
MITPKQVQGTPIKDAMPIVLLCTLCLVTYCRVFDVPFIFDDFAIVKKNPFIRDFGNFFQRQKALETFAAHPYVLTDTLNNFLTRPLSYLTFAINYHFHGIAVAGYHLVNIIIHTLNVLAVYALARVTARILDMGRALSADEVAFQEAVKIAFVTAALFAVHPLMTNSVTYITHRMTSLVALFYLTSLLVYVYGVICHQQVKKTALYALSFLLCCAAMLTKENAFTLPLMIVVYDTLFLQGALKQRIIRLTPFVLTMVIIPCNVMMLPKAGGLVPGNALISALNIVNFKQFSSWEYLLTQFRAVAFYISLLLKPTQLSLEHKFRVSHSLGDIDVVMSLALHLALFGYGSYLVWSSHKKSTHTVSNGLAGFGIIWFYGTLMVESSIIPLNVMVAEYRTYLPSFGFFLFIVCQVGRAIEKIFAHNNTANLKYLFWLPILCLLMTLTIRRNEVWRKPDELWIKTIYLYPTLARAYANLADHYIRTGALQNAIEVYRLSIKEMPAQPVLHYELGNVYLLSKQYDLAITELQRAIIMQPDMGKAYTSLSKAYVFTGRFEQAVESSKMADRLKR